MSNDLRAHWEQVYRGRATEELSWFAPHLERDLAMIGEVAPPTAAIIDVGGGASTLVDDLLAAGYRRVTVLDIAERGLAAARARLGPRASNVTWLRADVIGEALPEQAYDVWHDRAVFHFLTDPADRRAYVERLRHALKPGGHVVIATFALDGPERCSGLDVMRYDVSSLGKALGPDFTEPRSEHIVHVTPQGRRQAFSLHRFRFAGR